MSEYAIYASPATVRNRLVYGIKYHAELGDLKSAQSLLNTLSEFDKAHQPGAKALQPQEQDNDR